MKNNKQYIVHDADFIKREELYDYLEKRNYIFPDGKKEYYVNSKFPFVIDRNVVWICNSITCCAAAAQKGCIITIDEYFYLVNNYKNHVKLNK